eukprot:4960764-Prymnesium_polylepis.1
MWMPQMCTCTSNQSDRHTRVCMPAIVGEVDCGLRGLCAASMNDRSRWLRGWRHRPGPLAHACPRHAPAAVL